MDADNALEVVGGFGPYQYCLIVTMGVMLFMSEGLQVFLPAFTASEPPWECSDNSRACTMTGQFQPSDGDVYDMRCNMSRDDWRFVNDYTSIVTEWDLVCSKSILANMSSSIVFAGWLFGVIVFGVFSDKYGRKKSLFVSTQMTFIAALISAISPSFWFYVVCRLLVGFGIGGCLLILFILPAEYSGVRHRGTAGTLMWIFPTAGNMLSALLAFFIRDWRILTATASAPGIFLIGLWWFTPESIRWLLIQGRLVEAKKCLRDVAEANKRPWPEKDLALKPMAKNKESGDIRNLFSSKQILLQTLILWFIWFASALVYYGVSYSATILGGNMYLNFFLASLIEVPANIAAIFFMNWYGRKKAVVVGMLVAAAAALIALAFPYDENLGNYGGRLAVALVAKFWVLVAFDGIYVFSAELMPTVLRNAGMGTCSAVARIGSFSSLYIIWLRRINIMLPFGIIGAVALVACCLCAFLPETNLKPTAEVLQDLATKPSEELSMINIREENDQEHEPIKNC